MSVENIRTDVSKAVEPITNVPHENVRAGMESLSVQRIQALLGELVSELSRLGKDGDEPSGAYMTCQGAVIAANKTGTELSIIARGSESPLLDGAMESAAGYSRLVGYATTNAGRIGMSARVALPIAARLSEEIDAMGHYQQAAVRYIDEAAPLPAHVESQANAYIESIT